MSQAPRGKNDWIRSHYEKMVLLVALVALLFSCVLLTQRIQSDKDAAKPALARIDWKGSLVAPKDTLAFDAILVAARAEATNALAVAARTTVSERRVACVKCGKPIRYEAAECPFCLAVQPAIVDIEKLDTDDDGLPDKVELVLGLNPQDPSDAAGDLDNDGFTNLEEITAKTNPKEAADFPDPIVKLRVAGIKPVPFYLRFVTTSTLGDGTVRFQLNLQTLERTYFVKPGDVVLGYKVEQYNPAGPAGETLTMVRQSDKRSVVLVKGRPVTEQELAILFVSLIDKQRLPVQRLNDVFPVRGAEYKVVDIRRENVVIQNVKTGEKVTVPLWTSDERATMLGQPSAAAPATGALSQAPAAAAASVW
ncbi:MAG: Amuc_1099 family pilus-like system protein [Kiritimatiellia bacterium]